MQHFVIVESPVAGDPLFPLRQQAAPEMEQTAQDAEALYQLLLAAHHLQTGRFPTLEEDDEMFYEASTMVHNGQMFIIDAEEFKRLADSL